MTWGCQGAPGLTWFLGFLEGACGNLRTVTNRAGVTHLDFFWVAFHSFFLVYRPPQKGTRVHGGWYLGQFHPQRAGYWL